MTNETNDTSDQSADQPSLRQRIHSATGDREAEAKALADRTDVDIDAAREAVNRAHGNSTTRVRTAEEEATAEDAERVQRERS